VRGFPDRSRLAHRASAPAPPPASVLAFIEFLTDTTCSRATARRAGPDLRPMIDRLSSRPSTCCRGRCSIWAMRAPLASCRHPHRAGAAAAGHRRALWKAHHAYPDRAIAHVRRGRRSYLRPPAHDRPAGRARRVRQPPPLALLGAGAAAPRSTPRCAGMDGHRCSAVLLGLALLYRVSHSHPSRGRFSGWWPPTFPTFSPTSARASEAASCSWCDGLRSGSSDAPLWPAAAAGWSRPQCNPAAMIIGPDPSIAFDYAARSRRCSWSSRGGFVPLGPGAPLSTSSMCCCRRLAHTTPTAPTTRCRTLFMPPLAERIRAAFRFWLRAGHLPLHLPALALALSSERARVCRRRAWGAWRSGWNPAFGMSLGLRSARSSRTRSGVPVASTPAAGPLCRGPRQSSGAKVGVLALLGSSCSRLPQPCELIFPNLWTLAAIGVFVLGVWQNPLFRSGKGDPPAGGADGPWGEPRRRRREHRTGAHLEDARGAERKRQRTYRPHPGFRCPPGSVEPAFVMEDGHGAQR